MGVSIHPPPQLSGRNDRLWLFCCGRVALDPVGHSGLGLAGLFFHQHHHEGTIHVSLPGMGRVQETLLVSRSLHLLSLATDEHRSSQVFLWF